MLNVKKLKKKKSFEEMQGQTSGALCYDYVRFLYDISDCWDRSTSLERLHKTESPQKFKLVSSADPP